jgi:hypothetical protein
VTEYDVASPEESLEAARDILNRLYPLPPLPIVGPGDCEDCDRYAVLYHYGQLDLCRRCAHARQRVADQRAA